ncbi:ATP/GTP-binding protein [Streptomyces sp.]|uniref:ATP/GTP-binding protein n=1 Tax=Streptomyces sp. TaxID=1931 RepID=UPI0035C756A2
METDGTYDSRDTRGAAVPRPTPPPAPPTPPAPAPAAPAAPPPYPPGAGPAPGSPADAGTRGSPGSGTGGSPGAVPPPPAHAPGAAPGPQAAPPRPAGAPATTGAAGPATAAKGPVAEWLDAPRPEAAPGVWRFRHVPASPPRPARRIAPVTLAGVVVPLLLGLVLWSVWRNGGVPYLWVPLTALTPQEWWYYGTTSARGWEGGQARVVYGGVVFALITVTVTRLGAWGQLARHLLEPYRPPVRAALAAVAALLALTLVWPEAFPGVGWDPLPVVGPVLSLVVLVGGGFDVLTSPVLVYTLYALITAAVLWPFARLGGWGALVRTWLRPRPAPAGTPTAAQAAPRSQWPALREAGQARAADLLTGELHAGRMNEVDAARIDRHWQRARGDAGRLASFVDTVLRHGATAWAHPSGARDLPRRTAPHDLLLGQVRIGRCAAGERNPAAYRGAGLALDPAVLGTSLLAVGPSGAGKTARLTGPVAESLALQALTGDCAVVAVGSADAPLGPETAYDVVVRIGDPASPYDLDPYAGLTDPDEAAALLAEGLAGDVETVDTRRAATVLAQLIGPYRAVHGRFPAVPVLRELLEAAPHTLSALLARLPADAPTMRRELEARIRNAGGAADPAPLLADRLALLDRPAFADFFGAEPGGGDTGRVRPFSLRSVVQHPLRVLVQLPERGHEEASRLLTRLVLAQFLAAARGGTGRSHFVCLVLDDATGALTTGTVRSLQRLRPHHAGVVLGLRTLADVPDFLHGPLLAAVGCRAAFSGVTTWDGRGFSEAWGTEWVETVEVAQHAVFADQPMTRAYHALRKKLTGKAVTTDAVTRRTVERERWSASELAHSVPAGHAVISLTTVTGDHTPPILVDLRA